MHLCVFKDHLATWVGLYLWVCSHQAPVAESRPTKLIKRFSLASGYKSVRVSLASHYLTGIYWIANQRCECVRACWNTGLSGHTVKMDGYQSLWVHVQVQVPTVTWDVKCVCVCVCVCTRLCARACVCVFVCPGESCIACGCVRGVLDTFKI